MNLEYMQLALDEARSSIYLTSPNPRVGCVLVKNDEILARAGTQVAGQRHAEAQAIYLAKQKGIDLSGATAYVTLEPCSHFGRTPPCANALIEAKIARVVIGTLDPNPKVAGKGVHLLRQAGIEVTLLSDRDLIEQCVELNVGFMWRMLTQRPWVRSKIASSLDGKISLANGQSKWITSPASRKDGHHWRARSCAVLTGIGTILADDPTLNVREVPTVRQPYRIVLDTHLRCPLNAHILTVEPEKLIWVCSEEALKTESARVLRDKGVCLIAVPLTQEGMLNLSVLMSVLAEKDINEIHVEAGSTVNGALYQNELLDEMIWYQAPKILGHESKDVFTLPVLSDLEQVQPWEFVGSQCLDNDIRLRLRHKVHWRSIFNSNLLGM
ncbi:bifunctional diaminohydroxyphosphoribosylaminopyrimidine deaminase/5-amino-6-(5-phosphoribosylamino)uracil reductase RibD [Basilea psittacipulmonis]|uniref:bifunctional diaminohydroxyphosphoribosylaminopyrimidine deaminase/5-amino-6-(5-phosphoribosylamino)uracil reductase RibD n=1 Tax=Basilea psittacipulmonis TaxID=1472345 RepID=UPI001F02C3A2|nr:bifunctional diaminohydroxyphosphoribosylaminopyrimidine deaminase/5-amino-6-(5-phosphoribosylamino)uracil reductase RibD [Basilea psittacipulmonis]